MGNLTARLIINMLLVLALTSCTLMNEGNIMTDSEKRIYTEAELYALELGADYINKNYPDYDTTDKTLVVSSRDDVWVVTYELPAYMLGGSPVVEIDKKTEQIIKVYRTQ